MRIETPEGTYRIIRVLKKELSLCSYLAAGPCREAKEGDGQRFLLLEFVNPVLMRDIMTDFMEMKTEAEESKGQLCSDFVDCFVREKNLWAVFRYHEGMPLSEAARSAASSEERMMLWQGLLERLFMQKLPMYLRYEALNPANIVVDEGAAVWVNYELYETAQMHGELFSAVQKRLYESFCMLFSAETGVCHGDASGKKRGNQPVWHDGKPAEKSRGDMLACFGKKLAEGSFEDEITLYREFHELRARMPGGEDQQKKDGGIWLRSWRFVLEHTGAIWKCGYLLLVLALWGLFFWLCFRPKTAPEDRSRISVIGTVEIGEPEQ